MNKVKRVFIPGKEWVYFKVYAGYKTLDHILLHETNSIVNKAKKEKIILKWFFVRYADPDPHIRIRFLLSDQKHIGEMISIFSLELTPYVRSNEVWKIQIDTYKRELERYGCNYIEETESIFCKDSECVLSVIKYIDHLKNENFRWMAGFIMIDFFLSDFSFDLNSKHQLIKVLRDSFMSEFGFNKYNSKQLNMIYRAQRGTIESLFRTTNTQQELMCIRSLVEKRSKGLKSVIEQLQSKFKMDKKEKSNRDELLMSYIHMMLNRLFITKSRIYELVLYNFIERYYSSEIAKNIYTNQYESKHSPNYSSNMVGH